CCNDSIFPARILLGAWCSVNSFAFVTVWFTMIRKLKIAGLALSGLPVLAPSLEAYPRVFVRPTENDRVAIVVYAGSHGLALPSTSDYQKSLLSTAINNLTPSGSTNGAARIN